METEKMKEARIREQAMLKELREQQKQQRRAYILLLEKKFSVASSTLIRIQDILNTDCYIERNKLWSISARINEYERLLIDIVGHDEPIT